VPNRIKPTDDPAVETASTQTKSAVADSNPKTKPATAGFVRVGAVSTASRISVKPENLKPVNQAYRKKSQDAIS
jgi:hypothetical protein